MKVYFTVILSVSKFWTEKSKKTVLRFLFKISLPTTHWYKVSIYVLVTTQLICSAVTLILLPRSTVVLLLLAPTVHRLFMIPSSVFIALTK